MKIYHSRFEFLSLGRILEIRCLKHSNKPRKFSREDPLFDFVGVLSKNTSKNASMVFSYIFIFHKTIKLCAFLSQVLTDNSSSGPRYDHKDTPSRVKAKKGQKQHWCTFSGLDNSPKLFSSIKHFSDHGA